jgi:hypothetical protein
MLSAGMNNKLIGLSHSEPLTPCDLDTSVAKHRDNSASIGAVIALASGVVRLDAASVVSLVRRLRANARSYV